MTDADPHNVGTVPDDRLLAIVNSHRDLICRYTADLVFTFVNDAFCRFLHLTKDDVLTRPMHELLPPDEYASFRQVPYLLSTTTPMLHSERQMHAPDGAVTWVQWNDRAILDDAGNILEFQSIGHDVTMWRAVEEHLREREERYRAIVANAAMGICLVDAYGQFLECNPAFVQITGYPPEELTMLTLSQVTYSEDWTREAALFSPLWQVQGDGYTLEKRICTKAGTLCWVLAMTTVIHAAQGKPQYIVQVLQDITARKEAERIREEYDEKLRALSLQTTLSEERERRRIAQNLHDHIGQSLAIARIQLGKLIAEAAGEPADLRQVIEEVRTQLSEALDYSRTVTCELSPPVLHELGLVSALKWLARHFTERYHLTTELRTDDGFPPIVPEARVVLYHIIRELLFNVVKHAQASRALIRLSRQGETILVSVEDDGQGLPPEHTESAQNQYGLFSVRERVAQLGGTFMLHTSPHLGTRCTIQAPTRSVSDIPPGAKP